jgi:hypothetical protein
VNGIAGISKTFSDSWLDSWQDLAGADWRSGICPSNITTFAGATDCGAPSAVDEEGVISAHGGPASGVLSPRARRETRAASRAARAARRPRPRETAATPVTRRRNAAGARTRALRVRKLIRRRTKRTPVRSRFPPPRLPRYARSSQKRTRSSRAAMRFRTRR